MNPYASFLGELNAREVIGWTPDRVRAALEKIGEEGAERPLAPGKWNARQILCHLADCEMVFGVRLRQALAETHHTIQPFDQDAWAASYGAYQAKTAFAVFCSIRIWNLKFIDALPAGAGEKAVTHPERGEMTLQTIIETMAGHDLNHLGQLEKI